MECVNNVNNMECLFDKMIMFFFFCSEKTMIWISIYKKKYSLDSTKLETLVSCGYVVFDVLKTSHDKKSLYNLVQGIA